MSDLVIVILAFPIALVLHALAAAGVSFVMFCWRTRRMTYEQAMRSESERRLRP